MDRMLKEKNVEVRKVAEFDNIETIKRAGRGRIRFGYRTAARRFGRRTGRQINRCKTR